MKATESALKNALRSELEKHSKEELIDIIAGLSSAIVFNSIQLLKVLITFHA